MKIGGQQAGCKEDRYEMKGQKEATREEKACKGRHERESVEGKDARKEARKPDSM